FAPLARNLLGGGVRCSNCIYLGTNATILGLVHPCNQPFEPSSLYSATVLKNAFGHLRVDASGNLPPNRKFFLRRKMKIFNKKSKNSPSLQTQNPLLQFQPKLRRWWGPLG